MRPIRVAVVGTCASGKSTIVRELRWIGVDAYVVGQEHSIIPDLWSRRAPDALVYLDVDLATIRARRNRDWPQWIYETQQARLGHARSHATVVLDTARLSVAETVAAIERTLGEAGVHGAS